MPASNCAAASWTRVLVAVSANSLDANSRNIVTPTNASTLANTFVFVCQTELDTVKILWTCNSKKWRLLGRGNHARHISRKRRTEINSLNYVISSSFREIFNDSANEIVYLCRSMYNCSNIEDILRIRKRRFLQKYCALDNTVCALCRHQAETEFVSLET